MPYGLDIGTTAICAAWESDDGAATAAEPPVALRCESDALEGLEDSPEDLLSVSVDGTTYALGTDAERIAEEVGGDPEPFVSRGILGTEEYVEAALEAVVEAVLPAGADGRLCYTAPGTIVGGEEATRSHRDAVANTLEGLGYDATPVSAGFAVIYDQLADDNYTGLGVRLGAETTGVALAYYGVPVVAFSLAKGRDWIVETAAGATGHAPSQVAAICEEFVLDPDAATTDVEDALARACDDLAAAVINALRDAAASADLQQGLSVPVAVGGDRTIEGIDALLGGRLDAADLPVSIRGVTLADEPAGSAAKGALAAARDDVDAYEEVTWSGDAVGGSAAEADGTGRSDDESGTADSSAGAADDPGDPAQTTLSFDDAELEAGRTDVDRADDAIDQLFDRLADRDDEIESVSAAVQDLADDVAYVDERTAAVDQVDSLADRVASVSANLTALESDLAALDGAVDGIEGELDRLEAELAEVDGAAATEREAIATDVDAVRENLESVADDVASVLEHVEAVDDDLETITCQTADVEDDLTALRADLETADEERRSDHDALRGDVDALESALESLSDRVGGIDSRITERSDELTDRVERIDARFDDVESDLGEKIADVEAGFESLEDDLRSLDADLESRTGDLRTRGDDLEERATTLESRTERLEERTATLDETRDDLESRVEGVPDRIEGLEGTVEVLRDDLETLEGAVESTDGSTTDERSNDVSRPDEEHLEGIRTRLSTLEDAVDDVRGDCDAVGSQTDAQAASLATTAERLNGLEMTVDTVADRVETLESTVSSIGDELEGTSVREGPGNVGADPAELEADIESVRDRVATLADRLEVGSAAGTSDGADGEAMAGSDGPLQSGLLTPLIAGGAGAGVLVAVVVAAQGDVRFGVYIALVGVLLLAAAVLTSR